MIKGVKSIAEYAIKKWLQDQNFAMNHFRLEMNGDEAKLTDQNEDTLILVYDRNSKRVHVKE